MCILSGMCIYIYIYIYIYTVPVPVYNIYIYCTGTGTAGFILTPNWALGGRGPNAAKNYLNHTPFGFRPLQLAVWGGVYR
jgi:hypothetical protein